MPRLAPLRSPPIPLMRLQTESSFILSRQRKCCFACCAYNANCSQAVSGDEGGNVGEEGVKKGKEPRGRVSVSVRADDNDNKRNETAISSFAAQLAPSSAR